MNIFSYIMIALTTFILAIITLIDNSMQSPAAAPAAESSEEVAEDVVEEVAEDEALVGGKRRRKKYHRK